MRDRVVMITGANSGIGEDTSLATARMGAKLVMFARDEEKGEAAKAEIVKKSQNSSIDLLLADLSSLESYDEEIAQRLWDMSAKLTHLSWPAPQEMLR